MRTRRVASGAVLALVLATGATGCSVKRMAIGSLADTLAASGAVFASDDDPELVRDAVPFSLKTIESLLVEVPRHPGLLLSACSGFTQYAYAFIQTDAELVESSDFDRSEELRTRARRMYLRARDYCLRNLDLRYPGIGSTLQTAPGAAVAAATRADVPALYWTGASWGSAISLGLDRPELVADLPAVRALVGRALELDERYDRGALHTVMISLEAVSPAMGGSVERARAHFARAVELSGGLSAGPFVTLAASVSVAAQDRAEFMQLMERALAIDPDKQPETRLANLIAQKRARHLLSRIDELFVEGAGARTGHPSTLERISFGPPL